MPAGGALPLVLETAISSRTSRSGDRVVARLAEDVTVVLEGDEHTIDTRKSFWAAAVA